MFSQVEAEDLYRENSKLLRSCWDSRSLGSVPVVASGLFLLTMIYNDNKCKKILSDILGE